VFDAPEADGLLTITVARRAIAGHEQGGDAMRPIMLIGASLLLMAGVVAADAQGVGVPLGVNPSNPQDLTYRSNPQDLLVPGGSNRQDLVRPSPRINGPLPFPDRSETTVGSRPRSKSTVRHRKTVGRR
jgi:hypothetical protein